MCVDYVFRAKWDFKLNVLGARLKTKTNLEQAHYKFIIIKQLGKSRARKLILDIMPLSWDLTLL